MKKLALLIAFFFGLTTSTIAQESELLLPIFGNCSDTGYAESYVDKEHNEIAFATGNMVVRIRDNRIAEGVGTIYLHPQKKTFTLILNFPEDGKSCILLMGDDFAPVIGGSSS